jgi:hypothetical protein
VKPRKQVILLLIFLTGLSVVGRLLTSHVGGTGAFVIAALLILCWCTGAAWSVARLGLVRVDGITPPGGVVAV